MTKNGAIGICLAALIQWTGCEGEKVSETCRIEFGYIYNDQGHIEELTLDENGNGSVDARVEYTNTYTEAGWINEVTTKCFRSDDRIKYETVHELNESGRTIFSLYDGEEINVVMHEYGETVREEQSKFSYTAEYDPNNRLLTETTDLDADGTPDEKELYTYDANGYRTKYEIDEGADGSIDFLTNYTYTFTEQGQYQTVLWEDIGLITTITEFTYEYDAEGLLISRSIDVRQDGILEEQCTISYDDDGEEEFCEGYANGAPIWEKTERKDTEGKVLMNLTEQVDDGAASRNTYTYDESGNLHSVASEKRDNAESEWEDTAYSTYTYDADGKKLSETKDVLNWVPSTQSCADSYLPSAQITVRR